MALVIAVTKLQVDNVGITGAQEGPVPLIGEKKLAPGGGLRPPISLLLSEIRAIKAPVHPFLSISMHDSLIQKS